MTLTEHLRELRRRLVRAAIALALGAAVGYAIFPWVLELLIRPYCETLIDLRPQGSCELVALRPLEPFSVRIRTSLVVGAFVGGPVILYQLWRFVTPGLTSRERRYALPFVVLSQLMFAVGIVAGYLAIPRGLGVLLNVGGPQIEPFLAAQEYLSFFLAMSVAFGLVFLMPVLLVFLVLAGVLSGSALRRARPYAVIGMFVLAAFITPTADAVTLLLVAVPMTLFYELSVVAAWLIERSRGKRARR